MVHHQLLKKYNFPAASNWWEHVAEKCLENDLFEILYDFDIKLDKQISHQRPGIVLMDKIKRKTTIIDVAITADCRIDVKQTEKIQKYNSDRCTHCCWSCG